MIFTSYFASRKWNPSNGVSIAIWAPRGYTGPKYPALYPPQYLLQNFKEGRTSISQYTAIYTKDVLERLDPAKVAKDLDGKVLLCYEKSGSFCHRNIVAAWLRKHGFEAQEL